MSIQKIIKTRRLILRPTRLSDAKKIFNSYAQDLEVTRHVSWTPHQSVRETRNFMKACIKEWKTGTGFPWVITRAKDKKLIGMIGLRFSDVKLFSHKRHMMDVGYVVMRSEWNKGYVTEALKAVVSYAFSIPSVHRVWAICDVGNPASARLMEKVGMVREGRLRRYTFHPNISPEPCDVYLYAKVRYENGCSHLSAGVGRHRNTNIRSATEADAAAACGVLRRSIAECCVEDHGNDSSLLQAWLENKTPHNVRDWLTATGNYGIVAEVQGKVVGFAMLLPSGEIPLCYLVPEVRFIGVGKALLTVIEAEARRRGVAELSIESTKTARDFYARNGFSPSGSPTVEFGMEAYPMRKKIVST